MRTAFEKNGLEWLSIANLFFWPLSVKTKNIPKRSAFGISTNFCWVLNDVHLSCVKLQTSKTTSKCQFERNSNAKVTLIKRLLIHPRAKLVVDAPEATRIL